LRPSAAEALKAAIRRSLPLVAVLVVVGALASFALKQVQGPRHAASARVVHQPVDLGAVLTGIQPSYVDPRRLIETALTLARSPELYDRTADRLNLSSGTADTLQSSTKVSGGDQSDVIVFTTTTEHERNAVRWVNAISSEYVLWRSEITGAGVREAITQLEGQIRREGSTPTLREQLNRLRILQTLNTGGATVIERATSGSKVSPRPVRDALFGGALGLVVALMISGAREAFNTRIRSEADVEDALNRPVLASIQTLPKRVGLVTLGRHETRWGDTYALLAANVMQIRGGDSPVTIAVTSAIAGEGKTTTASNLAVALAQRGKRVILVDFDLRKPSLARFFRIPPESPGVLHLVDGEAELNAAMWQVSLNGRGPTAHITPVMDFGNGQVELSEGGVEGSLRVIGSGGQERGARVARSLRTAELLEQLREQADVVVLDTPPALATVEMAELSSNVDLVLVVVRHGKVTRRSLVALNRQAEAWRTDIGGAILTDAPPEEDEYYYYR
jgi:Mrp family chromosome partitioning ATPase